MSWQNPFSLPFCKLKALLDYSVRCKEHYLYHFICEHFVSASERPYKINIQDLFPTQTEFNKTFLENKILTFHALGMFEECLDICEVFAVNMSVDNIEVNDKFIEFLKKSDATKLLQVFGYFSDDEEDDDADTENIVRDVNFPEYITKDNKDQFQDTSDYQCTPERFKDDPQQNKHTSSTLVRKRRPPILSSQEVDSPLFRKSEKKKRKDSIKHSKFVQKKSIDLTIILETPTKLYPDIPSRASTPGCSQRISLLSLE